MSLVSFLVYLPLQVLFLPLAVVGTAIVAYRQLVVSRKLGVSGTAIEIINGRWTMHIFGIRTDEPTVALANALPNTSTFGLWLVLFPLWVKYKISGRLFLYPVMPARGEETMRDLVTARTVFFDRILERQMKDAGQFVVLGAGYDTRSYGTLHRSGIRFFEVDQKSVQGHKRASLATAGIDTGDTRFVEVDFASDDLFERLTAAGYDPEVKTVFLWEGVTLYLPEEAIRDTMKAVRRHSTSGSVLVADVYGERMIRFAKSRGTAQTLELTGEGVNFGLPFATTGHEADLRDLVESENLTVGECFFLGTASDKGPFSVVVEMLV